MNANTILIADNDKDLLKNLAARCRAIGLQVEQAGSAMSALAGIDSFHPSVVCLDVELPPGNALAVAELIAAGNDAAAGIPVILMTANDDPLSLARAGKMGARVVRKGDGFWERLEPAIRDSLGRAFHDVEATDRPYRRQLPAATEESLLGTVFELLCNDMGLRDDRPVDLEPPHETPNPWVLVIDDDPDFSWCLQKRLEKYGITVLRAFEGMQGYRVAFSRPVDAIICDYSMPNGRGDYILRRLKENPVTKDIPTIVLTGRKDAALERKLLNLGAVRYFTKPYNIAKLVGELRQHIRLPAGKTVRIGTEMKPAIP